MKSMWSSHIPNIDFLPLIVGANPDDPDEDDKDENEKDEDSQGTGGAGAGAGEHDSDDEGDPQKKISAQNEIIARMARQRDEDAQQLQELNEFKSKAEREKLSAEEQKDQELQEVTKERDTLKEGMQELVVQNAFLNSNEFEWHKPERALALVDLSEVEVVQSKDGKFSVKDPEKLKTAIKNLAESDPYLIKKNEDDGKDRVWKGKTGDPKPKKKDTDANAERQRLLEKFPALRK